MARTKLRGVKLNEISFVGKGDNKNADILLVKSAAPIVALGKNYKGKDKKEQLQKWFDEDVSKVDGVFKEEEAEMFADLLADKTIRDQVWGMVWMLEDSICSIMCDESGNDKGKMIATTVDQFKEAISSLTKKHPEGGIEEMAKTVEELEKEVADLIKERDELKKFNETLTGEKSALEKEKVDLIAKQTPADVKIDKSKLAPEVAALLDKLEKEAGDNSQVIKDMQDGIITKECIDKSAEFSSVSAEGVEVPSVLKSIKKHDAKLFDQVCTLFKTAHERIKAGGLFKENGLGDDPNVGATAYDKLVAKAKELQKADATISFAKAFDKVYANEHELRKQYNEEKRG